MTHQKFVMVAALIALPFTVPVTEAAAQSTTSFRDSYGRDTGRAVTNGNTTTLYDSYGRDTGRAVTHGNTTTIYDGYGRALGTAR